MLLFILLIRDFKHKNHTRTLKSAKDIHKIITINITENKSHISTSIKLVQTD